MSIEVMKLALEALETEQALRHGYSYRAGVRIVSTADEAINALRSAITQAEAKTDEPVAWVVMNGLSKYQVCGAKAPADALCAEMQKRHDLSGSLAAFHVQPLYTHPAPGVPEGFALVPLKATPKVAMVLYEGARGCFSPKVAEDLWQDALTAALPAMPLAASPVQKGGE